MAVAQGGLAPEFFAFPLDLTGVTTVVASGITEGRWLSGKPAEYPAPREVVLGKKFARQLEVKVGD